MKDFLTAAALAVCLSLTVGCGATYFTANTTATIAKDGSMSWSSNKNQENLKASFTRKDGNIESFTIETTATTPEAAIAAAMQSMGRMMDTLNALAAQLVPAAAKAGALAGS
jgi:hypothetical protein